VEALTREDGRYRLSVGAECLAADQVVVATGAFQQPHIPAFASELDPQLVQSLPSCTDLSCVFDH
jgi:cation diffusion facilitator CzcD-associated flavoprotein CzcO